MKICYIYREHEKNEHSIEAVFDTIARELEKKINISKWYKPANWIKTFSEIRQLRKEKFDLYHITGDVYYLWPFFPWNKTIMTVHDIGMYKNNPWSLKRWLFIFIGIFVPSFIHKTMTCVSSLTKSDLIRLLHISPNKLTVIENPLSLNINRQDKTFNSSCPVIMQIGTGWHKNLDTLIESVRGFECTLDIIGNPEKELIARMDEYQINYHISSNISTTEVCKHYENSDILYFVSRSEGFGLPIIEAQTIGRPVLTSLEEPTKSVSGNAAILLSPNDSIGIRKAIESLCLNVEFRNQLIDKGFENAAKYSKSKIAQQYLDLYNKLI